MCSRQAGHGQSGSIGSRLRRCALFREVEAPARARIVDQRRSVASEAGGRRAVEGVDARGHGVHDVVHVPDTEQVPRRLVGKPGERPAHHLAHLLLLLSERAADGDAVHARAGHVRARLGSQVLVDPALHDAVEQLAVGRVLAAPRHAAVEPAVRALHRARGVVALHVEGRALVERERDVGAERGLDLHRGLGAHEALGPIRVGAEAHALLLDRDHPRLALVAAALDLLGHRSVSHGEHLVAARVRDDRPPPPHELVQPAQLADQLVPRLDEQVERVAEHHVVAQLGHLARVERLHGRRRGQRNERGRADLPMRGLDHTGAGGAIARTDLEGGHKPHKGVRPHLRVEGLACHLLRLLLAQQREHRRGHVGQRAALAQFADIARDHQRYRVHRVGGVRAAVRLEHVVGVAVVGGHDADAAGFVHRLDDPAEALVHGLDCLHGGLDHPGVADHVRVREVDDPEAEVALAQRSTSASAAALALISGFLS